MVDEIVDVVRLVIGVEVARFVNVPIGTRTCAELDSIKLTVLVRSTVFIGLFVMIVPAEAAEEIDTTPGTTLTPFRQRAVAAVPLMASTIRFWP